LFEAGLKEKHLAVDSETARALLGYATGFWIAVHFYHIYNLIWGSQIALLNFLNAKIYATVEDLRGFYDFAAIQYPDTYASYSFDQYINFLRSQNLLRVDNDVYQITVKGRSFLLFLVNQALNQNKAS